MNKNKKKPSDLNVAADMSDAAIERRWRDVAQLHRLGVAIQTARHTGRKAQDPTHEAADRSQAK